jgi:hypothetical protein
MYWAKTFADARGGSATVDALAGKAGMMGDYLPLRDVRQVLQDDGLHQPQPARPAPGTTRRTT